MAQVQGSGSSQVKQLYSYDASGQLISVNYNGTEYYYLRNGQTDIVGLMDGSGTKVVEYTYDAWGKLISTTGTLATSLGADNPFRYRGYYYDTETGLYYLMTRYYDPEVCRFISADVYMTTGQGVLGGNMWAYCGNNPVNRADSQGDFFNTIIGGIVGGIIGGIAASIQGKSFWEGATSGAVSGAISGAAVDIGLLAAGAAVATCGAGAVLIGVGIAAVGGALGGVAGVGVSAAFGNEVTAVDYVAAAAIGGIFNVVSYGISAGVSVGAGSIKELFPSTAKATASSLSATVGITVVSTGLTDSLSYAGNTIVKKVTQKKKNGMVASSKSKGFPERLTSYACIY